MEKEKYKYSVGDKVRLIDYHEDNRPTTILGLIESSCVLEESRGGYYNWNLGDIELAD